MSSQHPLATLVALSTLFEADQLPYEQKLERDRPIAVAAQATTDEARLQSWLAAQSNEESESRAERWLFSWHIVQLVLCVLGLLAGAGLSTLVMQYDGSAPINIISSWIILAGLPFMLMFLWLLTLLPFRIPIVPLLSEVLQGAIFRPLGQRLFKLLEKPVVPGNGQPAAFYPSGKLLFAMSNGLMQWFALGLGSGSLFMALYLLASSDLAFAWSTSLSLSDTQLHSITSFISAPFSSIVNQASPSLELIQTSHYFRLEESANQQFSASDAAGRLTEWWPFIIASITFYAIVPRFITLLISGYRLKKAIQGDIRSLPDYERLMNRMSTPLVTTRHSAQSGENAFTAAVIDRNPTQFSLSAPVIYWNQIELDDSRLKKALKRRGLKVSDSYQAGGQYSTQHDTAIIDQIHKARQQNVMVLIKAWDAPISETTDWLEQLCDRLNGAIIILLIDPNNRPNMQQDALEHWQPVYHALHESGLYIEILEL